MPQPAWQARLARVIATEVRRYRDQRGLSAQQLADKCAGLGLEISRSTLADLENGRKATVNVAEMLVLARALEVPPVLLIVPLGRVDATEMLPDEPTDTWSAAKWITGESPWVPLRVLDDPPRVLDLFRTHDYYEREIRSAQLSADGARRQADGAESSGERDARLRSAEVYEAQMRQAVSALRGLRQFMRTRGLGPPPLRADWPGLARVEEQEREERAATGSSTQPVIAAIVTSRGNVLVGRRNDRTPPWTFIAGEQEPGELPDDTIIREVKEETTLEIRAGEVIGERDHPATGRRMIYLAARPVRGTKTRVGDETELAEVRWVGFDEAIELMPDMYPPVRDYLSRTLVAKGSRP